MTKLLTVIGINFNGLNPLYLYKSNYIDTNNTCYYIGDEVLNIKYILSLDYFFKNERNFALRNDVPYKLISDLMSYGTIRFAGEIININNIDYDVFFITF